MQRKFTAWLQRWRQRREHDLRQRLAQDADRTRLLMSAIIVDAHRVGAPVPIEIDATVVVFAAWARWLAGWAEEQ
jgi:hypothetical protein